MDAIKLNTFDDIAVSMAKVLGIGTTTTDEYDIFGRCVYLERNPFFNYIHLRDAATKECIGEAIDVSKLSGGSFYRYVEPITELLKANFQPTIK